MFCTKKDECPGPWRFGAMQASVLAAVMPIWGHYLLPTCCGPMCNMVVTTITSCLDSTLGPASGAAGQPPPPAHAPPDAGLVQQITEMGFSQPRVEEALRRVRLHVLGHPSSDKYEEFGERLTSAMNSLDAGEHDRGILSISSSA